MRSSLRKGEFVSKSNTFKVNDSGARSIAFIKRACLTGRIWATPCDFAGGGEAGGEMLQTRIRGLSENEDFFS